MSVLYRLRENKLTPSGTDYAAHVALRNSADTEAIIDRMLQQGSTVTRADIRAVLENFASASENLLLEGQRLNLMGLVDIFPSIRGKFEDTDDSFDPARHTLEASSMCGPRLRKAMRTFATAEKLDSEKPKPLLNKITDQASGDVNSVITPDKAATIKGRRLSFDPAEADEGIFLVDVSDGTEYHVLAQGMILMEPSRLVFYVPAGLPPAATYALEVRSHLNGVQDLRRGRLDALLSVP